MTPAGSARMTLSQARRIALAAQGLHRERPAGPATAGSVGRTFARLELLQIDAVNVLTRAHYLPLFSRLGPYDTALLDRLAEVAPRRMVEYWAHEASFVRPGHFADLRAWQRRRWMGEWAAEGPLQRALGDAILALLEASAPLTARQVAEHLGHAGPRDGSGWGWNWNHAKRALEILFAAGEVGSVGRTSQFERRYAPIGRVLPAGGDTLPDPDEAAERLVLAASAALGIASARCLADYFRLPVRAATAAADRLVSRGDLETATVEGWPGPRYLHPAAARPRRAAGRALLGPFDSMVFERRRLQDLFGFRYRLEIYVPAAQRVHGYYVLPFLLRDRMAARVDLRADRGAGRLEVRGAFAEPDAEPDTAVELAAELGLMAEWLGLDGVVVQPNGNLAAALAAAAATRSGTNAGHRS
ncbi:winged helix-turn-helix domain-containing protein [Arthrobacter ginkgonis]|uniref:Winged helix-turn-helix domain-containing protein n=2 Tax=Arthrobacter ginkgonis TaxID=1630594 RepID=A0ABP7CB16_9MICC